MVALYLDGGKLKADVTARLRNWPNADGEILIAASGSSRHSGLYGEILLEDLCGLAVDVKTQASTAAAAETARTTCGIRRAGAVAVRRDDGHAGGAGRGAAAQP